MPQPCWMVMPWRAKARINASGTAAPPTSERMPLGKRPPCRALGQRALVGLDQAQPDGRHTERHRRRLQRHQVEQVIGMQVRAGEHHLRALHHHAVRNAPAVGVEHRRGGHHHIGVAQAPDVGAHRHQRVQHRRAVRIDHALGSPGGAGRVAHRHRVVLVVLDVVEARGVGGLQQRFVVDVLGTDRGPGERKHDDLLEAVQVRELPVQRQQDVVDDEEAVLRVGGDPAELVGRQPQVQRVHHAAGSRNAEVALQVRMVVPAQRGHAVAALQAQLEQRGGQRARARGVFAIAVAPQRFVGQSRDDLVACEDRACPLQHVVERQADVHHRGLHRLAP